jgi:hypothetical protein
MISGKDVLFSLLFGRAEIDVYAADLVALSYKERWLSRYVYHLVYSCASYTSQFGGYSLILEGETSVPSCSQLQLTKYSSCRKTFCLFPTFLVCIIELCTPVFIVLVNIVAYARHSVIAMYLLMSCFIEFLVI